MEWNRITHQWDRNLDKNSVLSVQEFFHQNVGEEDKPNWLQLFEEVKEAWNYARKLKEFQFECETIDIPELSLKSPFQLTLAFLDNESKEALQNQKKIKSVLVLLMNYLRRLQNRFLRQCYIFQTT